MLLCEVIKGARPGAKYLTDHLLSLLVFGGAAAEFVLLPQFGTSTFFLLTLMALVDFLSGIALRTAARRAGASHAGMHGKPQQAEPESQFVPVAYASPFRAGACRRSWSCIHRVEPKIAQPEVTPHRRPSAARCRPPVCSPAIVRSRRRTGRANS